MRTYGKIPKKVKRSALAAVLTLSVLLVGATGYAATWDYYLQAGVVEIPAGAYNTSPQVPNEAILMWGYALCGVGALGACGPVTFPGPVLLANEGDTLNIHLNNALTPPTVTSGSIPVAYPSMISEPTSLIINGQPTTYAPVWVSVNHDGVPQAVTSNGSRTAGDVTSRVRSFNTETAVGNTGVYTWGPLSAGTYLYQSGTHPAVQVQMGLYGALKVYPAAYPVTLVAGVPTPPASGATTTVWAYDNASTAYNFDVTLVYSEIDQELHYSIASGLYGTPPPAPPGVPTRGQRTSTVDYSPSFFLINGQPYTSASLPISNVGMVNRTTLLRVLNAGLKEKTPTLLNMYMNLIAEDGNPYIYTTTTSTNIYYSKQQYAFLLPPGKTRDALITPAVAGNIAIFDRSLNLTNAALSPGGMLTYLQVAPPVVAAPKAKKK